MFVQVEEALNEGVCAHPLGTLSHDFVPVSLSNGLELVKHVFDDISIETFYLPLGITLKQVMEASMDPLLGKGILYGSIGFLQGITDLHC